MRHRSRARWQSALGTTRFIPAKSEKPQAALYSGQKPPRHARGVPPSCRRPFGATGRVGFGAAALRALIPRLHSNP